MDFALVSGNPALDLAGTLQWRRSDPVDLLVDPAALRSWLVQAGVVQDAVRVGPADLSRAVELREALYRLACDRLADREYDEAALGIVNRAAAGPPIEIALTPTGVRRRGDVDAALGEVARSLVVLLGAADAPPIKECGRAACTRLYLDRSRGARRSWCGMEECGNRVKAAAYRARRRAARTS
ncbi:CGNR zinc finger domain-containing protein [Actinomycetospora atypica]|uniref:CGNR zinc finger domain-containing protein n=1 Tax=Actinomycetospora atypica TaxID=1290095 RepID=A0ABV9YQ74_9PSEU